MAVVTFSYPDFVAAMPEFAGVSRGRATAMFLRAEALYLDNSDGSPVMDPDTRTYLFYLLVAHLLVLFGTGDAPGIATTPPGRIASATQGTVSTSFALEGVGTSPSAAFYSQTSYGLTFWTATQRFRSVRMYASGASGIGQAQAYGKTVSPWPLPPVNQSPPVVDPGSNSIGADTTDTTFYTGGDASSIGPTPPTTISGGNA